MRLYGHLHGKDYELSLEPEREHLVIRIGRRRVSIVLDENDERIRTAYVDDRRVEFGWTRTEDGYRIYLEGAEYDVVLRDPRTEILSRDIPAGLTGPIEVKAPIPGRITRILATEGQAIAKDQPVVCLDAMKLENEIGSPKAGRVESIAVRAGQAVDKGERLFVVS